MPTAGEYAEQALDYLENAKRLLSNGEVEKAGECVWGALAQALKAVAATRDSMLRSHAQLRNFARRLEDDMRDPGSFSFVDFLAAQQMHTNFYESALEREDVARVLDRTAFVVDRLLRLLPARG